MEHIDSLYGYALTLTRDATEAEDLVQETYVRAASAANRPDIDSNLKAWLFVIMRNAWLNHLRHNNNGPRFVELDLGEPAIVTHRRIPTLFTCVSWKGNRCGKRLRVCRTLIARSLCCVTSKDSLIRRSRQCWIVRRVPLCRVWAVRAEN